MPNDNLQDTDYSRLYELLRTKPRVRNKALVIVTPKPVVKQAYFVLPSDKILAVDRSAPCNVERDFSKDSGYVVSIEIALLFRKLQDIRPELRYVCKHTANVFGKKTCYIFKDTKRNINIALTRQEIKEQLTKG